MSFPLLCKNCTVENKGDNEQFNNSFIIVNMQDIEQLANVPARRGRPVGARDNAPRTRHAISKAEMLARIERLQRIGALGNTAQKVLGALGDASYWLTVIGKLEEQEDWSTIGKLMQFLLQMHEGRPHQRISITSANIQLTTEEIARARQVVRELIPQAPLLTTESTRTDGEHNALGGQAPEKGGNG